MIAKLVYNTVGSPRVLIVFENQQEKDLFGLEPKLVPAVIGRDGETDELQDMSFSFELDYENEE